jgi:hypothetical protein
MNFESFITKGEVPLSLYLPTMGKEISYVDAKSAAKVWELNIPTARRKLVPTTIPWGLCVNSLVNLSGVRFGDIPVEILNSTVSLTSPCYQRSTVSQK